MRLYKTWPPVPVYFMQNAQLCQVSNVRLSFFTWLNSIPVCNTFYYPLWPLFCFLLAIETSTAITKRVRYFFNSDFIYFGYVLSAGVASYHRSFSRCLKKLCVFLQGDSAMCYLCQWLHVGSLVSFSLSKITVFHIFLQETFILKNIAVGSFHANSNLTNGKYSCLNL